MCTYYARFYIFLCVYLFHFICPVTLQSTSILSHLSSLRLSQFVWFVSLLAAILFVVLQLCHAVFCTPPQWFSITSPSKPMVHMLPCGPWVSGRSQQESSALLLADRRALLSDWSTGELCSLIGRWHSIVVVYKRRAWLHHVFIPSHAAVVTGCALT